MKKILCLLTGLLVCNTAVGQVPAKKALSAAKALGSGVKNVPGVRAAGLRYVPGVKMPPVAGAMNASGAALLNRSAVERAVKRQVLRKQGLSAPAELIRKNIAEGKVSSGVLDAILAVPSTADRTALLQNEFLMLTTEKGLLPTPKQADQAAAIFRQDLEQKKKTFFEVKHSILQQPLTAQTEQSLVPVAQALADIAGLGLYGTAQDAPLLVSVYWENFAGVLEPVVFTSVARALISLQAYGELEKLLFDARPTEALEEMARFVRQKNLPVSVPVWDKTALHTEWNVLEEPLSRVNRLAALQLDFSTAATERWLEKTFRVQNSLRRAKARKNAAERKGAVAAKPNAAGQSLAKNPSAWTKKMTESLLGWTGLKGVGRNGKKAVAADPYHPDVPVLHRTPRTGLVSKQYPSGLKDENGIIRDWLEYFKNGYFYPRNQVEAIEGMSPAKANNVMEYLYYMPMEEAQRVILGPLRDTGRLPDFMYDARLISGTRRLPAGYYKNKFNENVRRFVELAEEDGTIYTHNVELKDLATTMADYSFQQGFRYTNSPELTNGLRRNWKELVDEIREPGLRADRDLINDLWRRPVRLDDGKKVSLKDYFTQTRPTAFFKKGRMPEFFLNSNKWVAWENERRNLAAAESMPQEPRSIWGKIQDWFVLGKRSSYLTLEQFGEVMASQYEQSYGSAVRTNEAEYTRGMSALELEDRIPSSTQITINNFDKLGGVCQSAFGDGGYMGKVRPGYDGTSTISRFDPVEFKNVPVVTFDVNTLKPQVVTLKSVPYLKDLKEPNLEQVRASTMVGDGLDPTRDLLGVRQAEAALKKIPQLKATLYPHARLEGYQSPIPPYLDGGGLGGYLALFTPDFYPLRKLYHLRFNGWRPYIETQYFVRKEVPAMAGLIHRNRLTFTGQVADRIVPQKTKKDSPADKK